MHAAGEVGQLEAPASQYAYVCLSSTTKDVNILNDRGLLCFATMSDVTWHCIEHKVLHRSAADGLDTPTSTSFHSNTAKTPTTWRDVVLFCCIFTQAFMLLSPLMLPPFHFVPSLLSLSLDSTQQAWNTYSDTQYLRNDLAFLVWCFADKYHIEV